jgi:hypothetical protein
MSPERPEMQKAEPSTSVIVPVGGPMTGTTLLIQGSAIVRGA